MSTFNPITHLVSATERAATRLMNDLNAIPDDRENHCPGGCARSAVHIAAECAVVNGAVATYLTTGEVIRPTPEQRETLLAAYDTKTKARQFLSDETERLIAAIRGLDVTTLGDPASFFPTRPSDIYTVAELPAWHMMYHDGQLCYIQTLYGDTDIHW
jgi:hypothetical protein